MAEQSSHGECARLALLCLALLERHKLNDKGRCQHCRTRRKWWYWRWQSCTVIPVVSLYLEQPREFLAVDVAR
jgi:hypothetical protein